ncbi:MAG: hypothetical protein FJ280_05190 [Planctomycetes bacterium]|nr:hypothetical protein [Planctomycetota bacterium]
MSRKIILKLMATAVMLAGCDAVRVAPERRGAVTGAAVGAGIGGLAGQAVGRNTASTLIGAAIGGGIGYLLGNRQDQQRAQAYDPATTTALTGTQWRVQQLNMPNPPAYQEMYLSFEPGSQLVTTQVTPDGRVVRAAETYRVADDMLIINRPAQGGQPGYIINADYARTNGTMRITSPQFSATLQEVSQLPAHAQAATPLF